ncbi:MAG: hypothetical protein ABIK09_15385 [Pseudomonadota bacterium]
MRRGVLILVLLVAAGCGGNGGSGGGDQDVAGSDQVDAVGDVVADVAVEIGGEVTLEVAEEIGDATVEDVDAGPLPIPVPVFGAIDPPPAGSVLPDGIEGCALVREEVCVEGTLRRCEIYDASAGDWAADPPAMTEQAFMFDRYYDLYHEAEGQTMDFRFTQAVPAGTPESEWSKPEYFRKYDGIGDASGWTGTAVWAAAARYRVTGTGADYQRMVSKLSKAMFGYELNGAPGMVIRSHFAMLPEGAPDPVGHWRRSISEYRDCSGDSGHFCYPIPAAWHDRLPDYYTEGVEIGGVHYDTTPYFQGDASRDMYVRALPGLLLAYDLLGEGDAEDTLREVMKTELSCTVNRMKKGRIINLDAQPELKGALMAYLAGGNMHFDEGEEAALTSLNELIFYVMEQPHPGHPDTFDFSCPDGPPMEFDPAYVFDAEDPFFILDLAGLALTESGSPSVEVPIAWTQHVSVRGSDALFMTQWALTAHYLTGDPQYLAFVEQLMEEIDYASSVLTYGALQLPKWCAPHFGPSLLYPSLYNVQARVDKAASPGFWNLFATAARTEGREKDLLGREDCFFGILYGRMVDETVDPDAAAYVAHHVDVLATYGMDPNNKLAPDRNYPRNWIDTPDPEVPLEEIPANSLAVCTEPIDVMGIEIPAPGLEDDWPRAVAAIPLPKRVGGAFLWQMDPWMAKREYGGTGMNEQWPMLGLTAAYWVGRSDGVIAEGAGMALAWRDLGACE